MWRVELRDPAVVPRCLFRLISYNKYVVIINVCDLLSARMLPKSLGGWARAFGREKEEG
jgi:hypothetical protein